MSYTVNSSDLEAVLNAQQRRLDEIKSEEDAEWEAFANDPANVDPPQENAARDVERSEILAAMARQRQAIEERDAKKKAAREGGKGDGKPGIKDGNVKDDDDDDDAETQTILQQVYRPIAK